MCKYPDRLGENDKDGALFFRGGGGGVSWLGKKLSAWEKMLK